MILLTDKRAPTGQLSKLKGYVCINTQTNPPGRYMMRDKLRIWGKDKQASCSDGARASPRSQGMLCEAVAGADPRGEGLWKKSPSKMPCVAPTQQASLGPAPVPQVKWTCSSLEAPGGAMPCSQSLVLLWWRQVYGALVLGPRACVEGSQARKGPGPARELWGWGMWALPAPSALRHVHLSAAGLQTDLCLVDDLLYCATHELSTWDLVFLPLFDWNLLWLSKVSWIFKKEKVGMLCAFNVDGGWLACPSWGGSGAGGRQGGS